MAGTDNKKGKSQASVQEEGESRRKAGDAKKANFPTREGETNGT